VLNLKNQKNEVVKNDHLSTVRPVEVLLLLRMRTAGNPAVRTHRNAKLEMRINLAV
jgi:hypothetical protein